MLQLTSGIVLMLHYRCLAIGRSHGFLAKSKEALALFFHALELASSSATSVQSSIDVEEPPRLDVSHGQTQTLQSTLRGLVQQYRGLVTLENISQKTSKSASGPPAIERLHEYNPDGLDLRNLVPYPPRMQPIPVKPLFLDVAWNYIDYPRESAAAQEGQLDKDSEERKGRRRGWFGFGR